MLAVNDLLLYSAHRARDNWTFFPHGFSYRKTETFLQAFLDDNRGVTLERIHHRCIFFGVIHWQTD